MLRAERAWLAGWPIAVWAIGFLTVALLDALPVLPAWMHLAVLVALGGGLAGLLWRAWSRYRPPTLAEAEARVERDSRLHHRPLGTLNDVPARPLDADPTTAALWRVHVARTLDRLGRIRVGAPRAPVATQDRLALRGLALLCLLVAIAATDADWSERLTDAVSPDFAFARPSVAARVDLLVNPPDYTGTAPVFITVESGRPGAARQSAPLDIPTGSTLTVRVAGGSDTPVLRLAGRDYDLAALAEGGFEAQTTVRGGETLWVRQGGDTLASWQIQVIPDTPPQATLPEPPTRTERNALRIPYRGQDDYGVVAMGARITLDRAALDAAARPIDSDPIAVDLALPGRAPPDYDGIAFTDLTPHPWAGLPVRLQVTATDAAGQTGVSGTMRFVLPEREFTHPIARAIVEQRRTLLRDPATARLPVAESLDTLSLRPDRYYDDTVVFLALRSAAERLQLIGPEDLVDAVGAIQRLLWDTALRIEDGDLSLAQQALRDAQQALRDALAGDADDDEIARLTEQLRQAMGRYLAAAQQDLMERLARGELPPPMAPPEGAEIIDQARLNEFLDQLQSMSDAGAREQAMAMLDQLQGMMEGLQIAPMMGQPSGTEAFQQLLEDFQDLIGAQQALQEQVFRDSQQTGTPQPGGAQQPPRPGQGQAGDTTQHADTQEALRRALGDLMRELGEMSGAIPPELGGAELSMREATRGLDGGDLAGAADAQGRAVEQLMQGLGSALEQMMSQATPGPGMLTLPPPRSGSDPLGRPTGSSGAFSTEGVELPAEADTQRAREIQRELRNRLGQRYRPMLELDYLERLLDQF